MTIHSRLNSGLHLTADAVLLGRSSPDLDDPDAPGPSASGMPGPSTAGQSADAQPNMQASDMEPEVSNGVQGADSEVRRSHGRHNKYMGKAPCSSIL